MAITVTKTENGDDKAWIGHTITLLIIILAIYIGIKHYKSPGFWYGFLVMVLLGVRVYTGENTGFDSTFLSVKDNKKY